MFVNGIMMVLCVYRYVINNLNYKKMKKYKFYSRE